MCHLMSVYRPFMIPGITVFFPGILERQIKPDGIMSGLETKGISRVNHELLLYVT